VTRPFSVPLMVAVTGHRDLLPAEFEGTRKLVREFLRFVLSKEGQEIVVKDGYYPLTAKIVQEEVAKLR